MIFLISGNLYVISCEDKGNNDIHAKRKTEENKKVYHSYCFHKPKSSFLY